MPVGTPFHARTAALCESLNYRDWSGYHTVSAYEAHHDHEYHAIREAAALIDISPLFKYSLSGPDALQLVDRVITRDASRMAEGQVFYTPWCDEDGKVIDDGTVARYEGRFRWTSADPTLRWLRLNAAGLRVTIEDESETVAALALQGPTSAAILRDTCGDAIASLRYFRATSGRIGGVPVDVSRTGYTGDLGYEIWMPADRALVVWDALVDAGRAHGLTPAGMLALDVARVEAGLLLIDVDFQSVRKATIPLQMYTPYELGLDRLVSLDKGPFIGRAALAEQQRRGTPRKIVGLEVDWAEVEAVYDEVRLVPLAPAAASRIAVPVARDGRQVGRATTTAWSPTLKRLLALATVDSPHFALGTRLEFEITVEAVRHYVSATVVPMPFFNPSRKTSTPPP